MRWTKYYSPETQRGSGRQRSRRGAERLASRGTLPLRGWTLPHPHRGWLPVRGWTPPTGDLAMGGPRGGGWEGGSKSRRPEMTSARPRPVPQAARVCDTWLGGIPVPDLWPQSPTPARRRGPSFPAGGGGERRRQLPGAWEPRGPRRPWRPQRRRWPLPAAFCSLEKKLCFLPQAPTQNLPVGAPSTSPRLWL